MSSCEDGLQPKNDGLQPTPEEHYTVLSKTPSGTGSQTRRSRVFRTGERISCAQLEAADPNDPWTQMPPRTTHLEAVAPRWRFLLVFFAGTAFPTDDFKASKGLPI